MYPLSHKSSYIWSTFFRTFHHFHGHTWYNLSRFFTAILLKANILYSNILKIVTTILEIFQFISSILQHCWANHQVKCACNHSYLFRFGAPPTTPLLGVAHLPPPLGKVWRTSHHHPIRCGAPPTSPCLGMAHFPPLSNYVWHTSHHPLVRCGAPPTNPRLSSAHLQLALCYVWPVFSTCSLPPTPACVFSAPCFTLRRWVDIYDSTLKAWIDDTWIRLIIHNFESGTTSHASGDHDRGINSLRHKIDGNRFPELTIAWWLVTLDQTDHVLILNHS